LSLRYYLLRYKKEKYSILKKLFVEKTDKFSIQFFRYALVGVTAFIVDFGTLFFLTRSVFFQKGFARIIAVSIAFILGLIVNYILSVLWVFQKRNVGNKKFEFIIFSIVGLIGLGMNELFIWLFTEYIFAMYFYIADIQARILISKIISTVVVYLWNFFARKFTLFKD